MFGIQELIVLSLTALLSSPGTSTPVRQPPPPPNPYQVGVLAVLQSPEMKQSAAHRLFEPTDLSNTLPAPNPAHTQETTCCTRQFIELRGLGPADGAFGRVLQLGHLRASQSPNILAALRHRQTSSLVQTRRAPKTLPRR